MKGVALPAERRDPSAILISVVPHRGRHYDTFIQMLTEEVAG